MNYKITILDKASGQAIGITERGNNAQIALNRIMQTFTISNVNKVVITITKINDIETIEQETDQAHTDAHAALATNDRDGWDGAATRAEQLEETGRPYIGDFVQITKKKSSRHGLLGRVTSTPTIDLSGNKRPFRGIMYSVEFGDKTTVCFKEDAIELAGIIY